MISDQRQRRLESAQPLMEAGLDSIGAVELRNAVTEKFGVELPATVTFDYPTADALAGFIASKTGAAPAHAGTLDAWPQPTMVSVPVPSSGAFVQQIAEDLQAIVSGASHLLCMPKETAYEHL